MSTVDGTEDDGPPEIDNLIKLDPYLKQYQDEIKRR